MTFKRLFAFVLFCVALSGLSVSVISAEPPSVPGLQLHLDASVSDSFVLADDMVLEWHDVSGNNTIVFSPWADTTPPQRLDDVVNGRAVVFFDASSLRSTSPDALSMTNDIGGATIFGVGWNTGDGSQNYLRIMTGTGVDRLMFLRHTTTHRILGRRLDSDAFQTLAGGPRLFEEWGIDTAVVDYAHAGAFFFINGSEVARTHEWLTPGRTSPTDSQNFVSVGSDNRVPPTQFWEGFIAEILFFDRVLSKDERDQIGLYLAEKYGLNYEVEADVIASRIEKSVEVRFATDSQNEYQVSYTDDGEEWIDEPLFVGTGDEVQVLLPYADRPAEFVRVIETRLEIHQPSGTEPEPLAIAGLEIQLDGAASDSITTDETGFFMEEWRDARDNGIVFFQDEPGFQPVHGLHMQNGLPVVTFDQRFMKTTSAAALSMTNDIEGITLVGVGWNRGGGAQQYIRFSTGTETPPGGSERAAFYRATNDHRVGGRRLDTDAFQSANGPPRLNQQWGIDMGILDYGNARASVLINGTEAVVVDSFQTPGRTSSTDSTSVLIGARDRRPSQQPDQYWDGEIAEILVFNRVLSVEELNIVGEYLSDKWAIPYTKTIQSEVAFQLTPGVRIDFETQVGNLYRVDSSEDLMGWSEFATGFIGTGAELTVFDQFDEKERSFYRVVQLD